MAFSAEAVADPQNRWDCGRRRIGRSGWTAHWRRWVGMLRARATTGGAGSARPFSVQASLCLWRSAWRRTRPRGRPRVALARAEFGRYRAVLARIPTTVAAFCQDAAASPRALGTGGGVQPAIERAHCRALALSVVPGNRRRSSMGGRQLAVLLVGGADRGGIGFGDNEHGRDDGEAQRNEQACYQALRNRAACRWDKPLPGNNM